MCELQALRSGGFVSAEPAEMADSCPLQALYILIEGAAVTFYNGHASHGLNLVVMRTCAVLRRGQMQVVLSRQLSSRPLR